MVIEDQVLTGYDLKLFHTRLMEWGRYNFMPFPWRTSRDPYRVFIAEVMLHRTRASQAAPVYLQFLKIFPRVSDLAATDGVTLRRVLSTLGLAWRVDLLKSTAKLIVECYDEEFPQERSSLEKLPGVGHYIASCILCFAYGMKEAVIDTNTVRVLARITGVEIRDSLRRNHSFHTLARIMLPAAHAREYNFALIDLAHKVCTPRNPAHTSCPIKGVCRFYRG